MSVHMAPELGWLTQAVQWLSPVGKHYLNSTTGKEGEMASTGLIDCLGVKQHLSFLPGNRADTYTPSYQREAKPQQLLRNGRSEV